MNPLDKALQVWLKDRPQAVKDAANRFPPGTAFKIHDKIMYVVAYTDSGGIMVSETSPLDNYSLSVTTREPVCKCCTDKLESLKTS